jgi:hypothetical protein
MNADPAVMEFFPSPLDPAASDLLIERFRDEFARVGFCPWAVETLNGATFIGFVGYQPPLATSHGAARHES